MSTEAEDPHVRLASYLEARADELDLDWSEVAHEAGISVETLRAIRRGRNNPSRGTKRGLDRAMQWQAGSVANILGGGEPTPVDVVTLRGSTSGAGPVPATGLIGRNLLQSAGRSLSSLGQLIEERREASKQGVTDAADKAALEPERWPTMLTLAHPQGYEITTLARMARAVGLNSDAIFGISDEVADEVLRIETTVAGHEMQEDLGASQAMIDDAKRKLGLLPGEQFRLVKKLIDELHKGA